ncbi:MAG TPA: hypothetical protein VGL53_18315 [Bryobacteraceae bacterium]|jgi:hypothetical protein
MSTTLEDPICKGPAPLLWKELAEQFKHLAKNNQAEDYLKNECSAASDLAERAFKGLEDESAAFSAVRIIYWKVSAAKIHMLPLTAAKTQARTGVQTDLETLAKIELLLERLCRVSTACCGGAGQASAAGSHDNSNTTALLEVMELSNRLNRAAAKVEGRRKELDPNFPANAAVNLKAKYCDPLVDAVREFGVSVKTAFDSEVACDAFQTSNTFDEMRAKSADIAYRFDNLVCEMARIKCLTQPAFFDLLQTEVDHLGLAASTVLGLVDKLSRTQTGIGAQLKQTWQLMRTLVTGALRQQFVKWQERQLCPTSLCYDTATEALRNAIDAGIADTENFGNDSHCWDEGRMRRQRNLIVAATEEVRKLHCKDLPDHGVLTRIGAQTMRLHSILSHSTTGLAVAVRSIVDGWTQTREWLDTPDNDPPPQVARHLRTLVGVYYWLENNLNGLSACQPSTQAGQPAVAVPNAPGFAPGEGEMIFDVVDPLGQPCTFCEVSIVDKTGTRTKVLTDQDGRFRGVFQKGPYQVTTEREDSGIPATAFSVWVH